MDHQLQLAQTLEMIHALQRIIGAVMIAISSHHPQMRIITMNLLIQYQYFKMLHLEIFRGKILLINKEIKTSKIIKSKNRLAESLEEVIFLDY